MAGLPLTTRGAKLAYLTITASRLGVWFAGESSAVQPPARFRACETSQLLGYCKLARFGASGRHSRYFGMGQDVGDHGRSQSDGARE
ncbi:hypothetical protein K491DRAFT_691622 [Lophiostoma macrostomum CBS 122681]|uniref:Uncharacterized protein n=1 Tax=Lophiostoma macrostomum CBS 122681 TaxID=1314788 RepID=A0A6A6TCY1_9PLEO|nr:hypothetical protein K491DRAFT_691622 [Lophiostoma macrostomum CBS 122681]